MIGVRDDMNFFPPADMFSRHVAVHHRHLDVHENDIRNVTAGDQINGLLPITHQVYFKSQLGQQCLDHHAIDQVVFSHQYPSTDRSVGLTVQSAIGLAKLQSW
jgi:hypothetical protein